MMEATKPTYRVTTWDMDRQEFTPQTGLNPGPYTQWELRVVLRWLSNRGYDVKRAFAPSVLVERINF
jgi:hypothetical protein